MIFPSASVTIISLATTAGLVMGMGGPSGSFGWSPSSSSCGAARPLGFRERVTATCIFLNENFAMNLNAFKISFNNLNGDFIMKVNKPDSPPLFVNCLERLITFSHDLEVAFAIIIFPLENLICLYINLFSKSRLYFFPFF